MTRRLDNYNPAVMAIVCPKCGAGQYQRCMGKYRTKSEPCNLRVKEANA